MMSIRAFIASMILLSQVCNSWGQEHYHITGRTVDENNAPLSWVNVGLFSESDSEFVSGTASNLDGQFTLRQVKRGSYEIRFSFVGYETSTIRISILDQNVDVGTVAMAPSAQALEQVTVEGTQRRVALQSDTAVYHAGAYRVNPDADAGDLMAKMPGITIDNGKLQAHGEDVRRVTLDGQEYFGDDAMIALRNLPAEIISRIEVFDGQSDQARFSGMMDAATYKIINIITENPGARITFGRLYAGGGTEERCNTGGNANYFNGNRKISLIGTYNNINLQNFSAEDLLGTSAGGMQPGQGMGGRPPGVGSGSPFGQQENDFQVGEQGGINTTSSLGLNYADNWGKKIKINGSYFFNQVDNLTKTKTTRDYFVADPESPGLLYREDRIMESRNQNHRIKLKVDAQIDSLNSILFTPRLSFQQYKGSDLLTAQNTTYGNQVLSETNNRSENQSSGFILDGSLLYMHRFRKEGRTLSLNLQKELSSSDSEEMLDYISYDFEGVSIPEENDQITLTGYDSDTHSANLNYTEPLSPRITLMLSYNPSLVKMGNNKENYLADEEGEFTRFDSLISNTLETRIVSQKAGASLQYGGKRTTLNVGLSYQMNQLEGSYLFPELDPISKQYPGLLPTIMFMYKFSSATNIRMFLRSGNTLPSMVQLQETVDNSNPMQLRLGNSDLEQENYRMLLARFATTNTYKGRSFFAFMMLQQKSNHIGSRVYFAREDTLLINGIELLPNTQLSTYGNYDNYWNLRSFITYSTPVKFLRCNLNLNGGAGFSQIPGESNDILNYAYQTNLSLGAVLSSNISEALDFNLSYTANRNWVTNSTLQNNDSNYTIHNASFNFNYLAGSRFLVQTESSLNIYQGLGDLENNTPLIINAAIAYKFLNGRNLEARLSVYDLLNQNLGISRNVTAAFSEDVVTNVMQQYFMLTLTYKFNRMI